MRTLRETGLRQPLLWACSLAILGCTSTQPSSTATVPPTVAKTPPPTRVENVIDTHHGIPVKDPYRWLESPSSDEVNSFIKAQNAYARSLLDSSPDREALRTQLEAVIGKSSNRYTGLSEVQGQIYALKTQPPKQHAFVVVMPGLEQTEQERVVLDPELVDPKGKTAIDWFRVSPDGKLVAASLSVDGSEAGSVSIFDTATGKRVFELIPGVNAGTAGGDLAWAPDSSGFYYTRYPRGQERPEADKLFYAQLYFHKLGTATEQDQFELGRNFSRIAEYFLSVDRSGKVLVAVQKGDGGEFQHYLRVGSSQWKQIADYSDQIKQFFFGEKNDLYALSLKDAPRGKILRLSLQDLSLKRAKVIIPEDKASVDVNVTEGQGFHVHKGRLAISYQTGGPTELRTFDLDGKPIPGPQRTPVARVDNVFGLTNGDLVFAQSSFLEPTAYYRYSVSTGQTVKTKLQEQSSLDLSGVTVRREMAKSKDGTSIPVNILLPPGIKPGTPIPFVLYGYGGFGISMEPSFLGARGILLKSGVGYAIANIRGGSEYGEPWHAEGALTKKQNGYDDFIAAAEYLIAQKYTQANKLAINGGSNGGLLMGAMITQRPELFAAVVASVGYFDMVRLESEPNGQFNTTEYGTIANEADFKAMYGYSPYHRVKDGVSYPPMLMQVGATDQRVAPWHSRKMVARLQAASVSGAPALLTTTFDAGHGMGSSISQRIAQSLDAYSFILKYIGAKQVSEPAKP